MAKWSKGMTASQRVKYNKRMRFRHLEVELRRWVRGERGNPPHPRKSDPNLLELYKRYNAEHLVVIPMSWMSKDQVKKARNRERYKRSCQWT